MKTRIEDEFTGLAVSRQRKYQLRMQQQQRCIICGEPSVTAAHCLLHAIKYREQRRSKLNVRRRYYGARTYGLQSRNGDGGELRLTGRDASGAQLFYELKRAR